MAETAPAQRRLAAILAADVAGYSRLMGADEEGASLNPSFARGRFLSGPFRVWAGEPKLAIEHRELLLSGLRLAIGQTAG